mmetsp:Transcript_16220/g.38872  ORF Transcript_16220/g.38872 Transcript_16220/m.38872 type:complete len:267 (-) Transcript_16220:504-1304(-)
MRTYGDCAQSETKRFRLGISAAHSSTRALHAPPRALARRSTLLSCVHWLSTKTTLFAPSDVMREWLRFRSFSAVQRARTAESAVAPSVPTSFSLRSRYERWVQLGRAAESVVIPSGEMPFLLTLRNVSGTLPACKPAQIPRRPASWIEFRLRLRCVRRGESTNVRPTAHAPSGPMSLYRRSRSSILGHDPSTSATDVVPWSAMKLWWMVKCVRVELPHSTAATAVAPSGPMLLKLMSSICSEEHSRRSRASCLAPSGPRALPARLS